MHIFYGESLSKYTGWCSNDFTAEGLPRRDADAYDGLRGEFAGCLAALQLEHVELLLMHYPGQLQPWAVEPSVHHPAHFLQTVASERYRVVHE
jgi:hypothetical protein